MSWMATVGAGCATVSVMVVEAELPWASLMVMGRAMEPEDVVVTVVVKEKVPSPLSVKAWVWLPPMRRRSPMTAMLVLGTGEVAGVTATVSTVDWPAMREAGLAEPVALRAPVAPPQLELWGVGGEITVKSAELLLVLVEETVRMTDCVLVLVELGPGAAALPLKQLAVEP